MMGEWYVRVDLYWGGQITNEVGSITYNQPPEAVQRFPLMLKYERLQCIFWSTMGVTDPELSVVISGRYPISFMANGFSIYSETRICDDDSLASFLESPDTFSSHISITMLDIQSNVIRNSGTQYEQGIDMHNHNFEWSRQNHEMTGPSNPPTSLQNLNLSGGHPMHSNQNEPLDRLITLQDMEILFGMVVHDNPVLNVGARGVGLGACYSTATRPARGINMSLIFHKQHLHVSALVVGFTKMRLETWLMLLGMLMDMKDNIDWRTIEEKPNTSDEDRSIAQQFDVISVEYMTATFLELD
ncbi:hypothetical protein HAX54_041736 [Datura stramonium]|uniref:Uncharacterized protein n=1 Tax=Datura stramonium TaxID=4076 RepID=A0ABS8W2D6_DATST|nr:hypothetical protein [Datura stramonium]